MTTQEFYRLYDAKVPKETGSGSLTDAEKDELLADLRAAKKRAKEARI